ncbi:VOC family protein [Nonomuraea gerenzanensis]|uniref:Putative hydroxylase n=1 Tax=Nonomuraea gerenzanensis TaxID=93944 RepID=A0A1M4EHV2_9ACTN|nr:VOC family protein [Nonomuraea gerenzanensis]UBU10166.1 VOC family protein [Nonomuraea gerenzanensis]SBO98541.1 putative hydroxylase [Nonomuraea gerenzanensis]
MLTTHYLPGSPCWVDVSTPDPEASTAFYTGLFGWGSISLGPEHRHYRFCQLDGRTVAGISPQLPPGAVPAWLIYFQAPDADAITKTIEQAGGTVVAAPFDIEGQGRMAVFADPAGAAFAVWQPGATKGLGLVTDPGSLGWVELYTPDPVGIRAFYQSVFGWRIEDLPMGDVSYPVISPAEGDESSAAAGIAQLQAGDRPHWLPYFEVSDCDATVALAQQLGATMQAPAMTTEGVGRMAFLTDPFGARFAVITSSA